MRIQIELITQPLWHRTPRPLGVRLVEEEEDFTRRVGLLKRFDSEEVRALAALELSARRCHLRDVSES